MSKVSLIIPCHNHVKSLRRAVSYGLQQTALEEIIIVDDASTDHSYDEAQRLVDADSRIRVIQAEQNLGPGGARNLGVDAAVGEYVCFLDADDELMGDFFQEALDLMQDRPDMKAVKPEEEFFDPVKGYILPVFDPRHQAVVLSSVHGLVIERELFLQMGGFPEGEIFRGSFGGEDVALMQALLKFCQPLGRIERPCYRVWSCPDSHVDRFLQNTRLTSDGFEFVHLFPEQVPGGVLSKAIESYLDEIKAKLV